MLRGPNEGSFIGTGKSADVRDVKTINPTVRASKVRPTQGRDERRSATDKMLLDSLEASRQLLAAKVRRLRRSIAEDRYDSEMKLSIALDRLISNVIG